MPTVPKFSEIQAWLHTFVVAPGSQEEALKAAEHKSGLGADSANRLVLPSSELSPIQRIQIYRGMYLLRMQEALEIDFPTVHWYLGKKQFENLVARYVESYPSQSYTLDHLGRHFDDFLRESNWNGEGDALGDLASLEWAICMVTVAHNSPSLEMADLASVSEDCFLDLSFEPVKAFQLLEFQYDVNNLIKACSADSETFLPQKMRTSLVVWRHELRVWRMTLKPAQFDFLNELSRNRTLAQAIDSTLGKHQEDEETLFKWFQDWLSEGLFSSFTVSSKPA